MMGLASSPAQFSPFYVAPDSLEEVIDHRAEDIENDRDDRCLGRITREVIGDSH